MGNGTVREARLGFAARFLRGFAWVVVHIVQRPKLYGLRPSLDAPAIFVCRHVGLMDPVILMVEYFGKMIRPLVAKDYVESNGFTRRFYRIAQCIPIDRREASRQWLEDSLEALGKGESVIIFPEGTRNKSGKGLLPFHNGAALLAARSGARVVPVYNAVWHFPHRYRLAIGGSVQLDPLPERGETPSWLREQTAKIRAAVEELGHKIEE